jgi:hypothetical protein
MDSVVSLLRPFRILIAVVALAFGAELTAAFEAQTTRVQDGETVFVRPNRRFSVDAPAPPAALPSRADEVQPLTFEVVTRRTSRTGAVSTERQRVSRTRDRIHMVTPRTEWLFDRNPVDPRRVSASLIHHPSRSIVVHEESDLRNTVGINGWAAVLTLGVDLNAFASLTPTEELRTHAGLQFRKHIAAADGLGLAEVWWNPDHLLLLTLMIRDAAGLTNVTVQGLRRGVDETLLRSPSSRFPEYKQVDLAEWLEGH